MSRAPRIGVGTAVAVVLAVLASGAASSDIYITGTVLGRVQGSTASRVKIAWDYKCLGEDRGSYEWTLKVVRTQPPPEKTTTLGSGTSERGEQTIPLTPGVYVPKADPYTCETDRGQGYDKPEIGGQFTVPDYCAWTVVTTRGPVELEHGSAVKLARPGSTVAPGDSLATPGGGLASISSLAGEGKASLAGGSRLGLDARHCGAKGGWKLILEGGAVTVSVAPRAPAKGSFQTATPNATVSGRRGAGWRIQLAKRTTKIRALAGTVTVTKKSGAQVTLKSGQSATVP